MKRKQLAPIVFSLCFFCVCQLQGAPSSIFIEKEMGTLDILTQTAAAPQPWGLGIAAFFTMLGSVVLNVRSSDSALWNENEN